MKQAVLPDSAISELDVMFNCHLNLHSYERSKKSLRSTNAENSGAIKLTGRPKTACQDSETTAGVDGGVSSLHEIGAVLPTFDANSNESHNQISLNEAVQSTSGKQVFKRKMSDNYLVHQMANRLSCLKQDRRRTRRNSSHEPGGRSRLTLEKTSRSKRIKKMLRVFQ